MNETYIVKARHMNVPLPKKKVFIYNISTFGYSGDKEFVTFVPSNGAEIYLGRKGLLYLHPKTVCDLNIYWIHLQYNQTFDWFLGTWKVLPDKQLIFLAKFDSLVEMEFTNCNMLLKVHNPLRKEIINKRLKSFYFGETLLPVKKYHKQSFNYKGNTFSMHTSWLFNAEKRVSNGGSKFVTWFQAETDCQNRSGHLVTILDKISYLMTILCQQCIQVWS